MASVDFKPIAILKVPPFHFLIAESDHVRRGACGVKQIWLLFVLGPNNIHSSSKPRTRGLCFKPWTILSTGFWLEFGF